MRMKWNCGCKEHLLNYKVPDSIYNYFHIKTSSITSSRHLWCSVLCPVSPADLKAAAGDTSRWVTSILHQVEEATSLYFETTEGWWATLSHELEVSSGGRLVPPGGSPASALMGVSAQRFWASCPLVRQGWGVVHTVPQQAGALVAHRGNQHTIFLSFLTLTPSILLSFPIKPSTSQPLPQALFSEAITLA